MKQYVLGVDGGNTKTDYFIFDIHGEYVDHIQDGTCSHEGLKDKYEGSYRIMKRNIETLLERNNIPSESILTGAFGLAGVDVIDQRKNLEKVIKRFGIKKIVVDNDSFLGIKAGIAKGYGVCCVNGTGTVVGGIDPKGNRLQVGGIGQISGDEAGGGMITRKVLRRVYDQLYRCSESTALTAPVMELLGIEHKQDYVQAISKLYSEQFSHIPYLSLVFDYAQKGEKAAYEIIDQTALQLAKSTAGCINNLSFQNEVDISLVGSVWIKPKTDILIKRYKYHMEKLTDVTCHYTLLEVPPATGAVLWALELASEDVVDASTREKVIASVKAIQK